MVSKQSSRKRKRTNETSNSNGEKCLNKNNSDDMSVAMFKPLFEDMFDGATYQRINPFACVRIVRTRPISSGGVRRLMALFRSNYKHVDDICSTGLTFGTDTPIVVELKGELNHLLVDNFKAEGLSDEGIDEMISRHDTWYGIIDGGHSNEAIKSLSTTLPEWKGFRWFVTVINGGHSMERYRQLSRAQNSRHSPRFYVDLTLFDELQNLRLEHDSLVMRQSKPTQIEVARTYFGADHVSNTGKFLASMAIRLHSRTLNELGIIMNKEMPEECLNHDSFDSCGAQTSDDLLRTVDCRIFRKFITLHSLRMSTSFMNASTPTEIDAQVNTLHRAKEYFMLNGLRPVQYFVINDQYKMALWALAEENKFLKYIHSEDWPSEMATVRHNLLRSTILDSEIEANHGNECTVLSTLRNSLLSVNPNLVQISDERLRQSTEDTSSRSTDLVNDGNNQPSSDSANEPIPPEPPCEPVESEEDIEKKKQQHRLDKLHSHGIDCFNLDWRTHLTTVWTSDSPQADTIITEPPPITSRTYLGLLGNHTSTRFEEEISKEDVLGFPTLLKRILKPGGYVIIILNVEAFGEWFVSFMKAGYIAMDFPYVFGYRSDTIQDRNPTFLPQRGADHGLIAYLPAELQFCPDFKAMFAELGGQKKRNLAIMSDIPAPRSKLCRPGSRSPFNNGEKSVKLLMECIDLFTPKGGLVMDMFGGTMTTAMAALIKGRRCICIEKGTELFNAAVVRLECSIPKASIVSAQQFVLCTDVQSLEPDHVNNENENENLDDDINDSETPTAITKPSENNENECETHEDDSDASLPYILETPTAKTKPSERNVGNIRDDSALQTLAKAVEQEVDEVQKYGLKRVRSMFSQTLGSILPNGSAN